MKERIAAITSFMFCIGWSIYCVSWILGHGIRGNVDGFMNFAMLTLTTSTIMYIVWTKFGKIEMNELERLNYENRILEKKIEQKVLKEKFEDQKGH